MAVKVTYEKTSPTLDTYGIGAQALPELNLDYSALSQEDRNQEHTGARFLCAASLACFTNTFTNALVRNGAPVKSMTASAEISKEKDDLMRTRYTEIILKVEVGLDESHAEIFETVKDNMLAGSLVTYTLEDVIEFDYDLTMKAV